MGIEFVDEGKLSGFGLDFILISGMSLLSIGLPVDTMTELDGKSSIALSCIDTYGSSFSLQQLPK